MPQKSESFLVFGGSGAIGRAIISAALKRKWGVTAAARTLPQRRQGSVKWISIDPSRQPIASDQLETGAPYSGICWAQGTNVDDSVYSFDPAKHLEVYQANCVYILMTLQALLERNLLAKGARMCVISSIWQNLARQTKLSYCMSKAALQGLVLSASADLAQDGHLINAVLPGAIDTPMTQKRLSEVQIKELRAATGFKRLPAREEVASLVCYLCSAENTGMTGQFIAVDLGFSHVRLV